MIKVTKFINTDLNTNSYLVSAFADTKSEVTPSAEIVGLPKDATIEMGSMIYTADGDVAFMKSDGTWNWVSSS